MHKYYETPEHLIAASIALAVANAVAVPLKFWTRLRMKQPLKADDWLLVPATVLTVGISAMLTTGAFLDGLGSPPLHAAPQGKAELAAFEVAQLTLARKIQYPFLMLHPLTLGLIRCSFLFLYLRVFSIQKTRKLIIGSIALVAAWSVAFFLSEVFQCGANFSANWGSVAEFSDKCSQTLWIVFWVSLSGFLLDLYILVLPMAFIWKLHLTTAKKLGVMSIFLMGSLTVAASLLRFANMAKPLIANIGSVQKAQAVPVPQEERIGNLTSNLYWGMVEAGVAIVAACLPTIQILLRARDRRSAPLWKLSGGSSSNCATPTSQITGADLFVSRPQIQVDHAVYVAYGENDADTDPIMGRPGARAQARQQPEDSMRDLEMQLGSMKSMTRVEAQGVRSALT